MLDTLVAGERPLGMVLPRGSFIPPGHYQPMVVLWIMPWTMQGVLSWCEESLCHPQDHCTGDQTQDFALARHCDTCVEAPKKPWPELAQDPADQQLPWSVLQSPAESTELA